MDIKNIDTSKFLEDPQKRDFVKNMESRSSAFVFDISSVDYKKSLIYITLMYDKESYFRKGISNYLERKYEAGITAGFVLQPDNQFAKPVESALIGNRDEFNRAIIQYISLQYDLEYAKLVVYELEYYKLLMRAMKEMDRKGDTKKQIDSINNEIRELEKKIFGGEEVINVRKALYEGTARTRLRLRPEDMNDEYAINKLTNLSPWGDYNLDIANVVNFAGDETPKE